MKKMIFIFILVTVIGFGLNTTAQNNENSYVSQDLCTKDGPKKHIFLSSSGFFKLTDGTWKETYCKGSYVINSKDEIILTYKENGTTKTIKGRVVWLHKIEGLMQLDVLYLQNRKYQDIYCN